jgi:hypothetical protein
MAKYSKDDCRFTKKENRAKQLFSEYPKLVKGSLFEGDNRKERRGIMARFRKVYGKVAYITAKERIKHGSNLRKFIATWLEETVKDSKTRARIGNFIYNR